MMNQIVNIKKVSLDSELKATIVLEFEITDKEGRENLFSLMRLQGGLADAMFTSLQEPLPFETATPKTKVETV